MENVEQAHIYFHIQPTYEPSKLTSEELAETDVTDLLIQCNG